MQKLQKPEDALGGHGSQETQGTKGTQGEWGQGDRHSFTPSLLQIKMINLFT